MNISLFDIKYFLQVVETKNISKAAKNIGIRQPSLSLAIQKLEQTVNCKLFARSKTGVELTRHGHIFLEKSKVIMEQFNEIINLTRKTDTEMIGRFLIGSPPLINCNVFPRFVPQLLKKHQSIQIVISSGYSPDLVNEVLALKLDFAIVANPLEHPDLVIKELAKERIGFWSTKKNHKVNFEKDILFLNPPVVQVQNLMQKIEKKNKRFMNIVSIDSIETIASLTEKSDGIGMLDELATKQYNTRPMYLIKELPQGFNRICLVYRYDCQRSAAAKEIINAISLIDLFD